MAIRRNRLYKQTFTAPAGQTTASRGAFGGGMVQAPGAATPQRSNSGTNLANVAGLLWLMKQGANSLDKVRSDETTPDGAEYRFFGPAAGSEIPAGGTPGGETPTVQGTPLSEETLRQINRTPEQIASEAEAAGNPVSSSWWGSLWDSMTSPWSK